MPIDPTRRRELAAFFATHHDRLTDAVRRRASGLDEATVEDACQNAWAILLRRRDITLDASGLAWLKTVAVREAWALGARGRREPASGPLGLVPRQADEPAELPEPPGDEAAVSDQVIARLEHQARRAALARLKTTERQTLWLQAAGYSYAEIQQLTGASLTAVNRRISEGRAALRRAA